MRFSLPWTFHIQPSSPTRAKIDTWNTTSRKAKAIFRCNAVVILPSLGMKYTMTNGVLKSWKILPSAARVLQPMAGLIEWESITAEEYNA